MCSTCHHCAHVYATRNRIARMCEIAIVIGIAMQSFGNYKSFVDIGGKFDVGCTTKLAPNLVCKCMITISCFRPNSRNAPNLVWHFDAHAHTRARSLTHSGTATRG